MKHRRIVVTKRGGPELMQVLEEDIPEPAAGEVRINVQAAGVSAYDIMVRMNWFPGESKPPYTPGLDVAGVVDKIGEGVSSFTEGDQVVAGLFEIDAAGYAEYVCVPEVRVVATPSGLDPAQAVCLVVNYLTAHGAMHATAKVKSGEQVLIHGAAGGVGSALVDLGKLGGLEMYGTVSQGNMDFLSDMGVTPIDYKNEDFVDRIHSLTGDGVDVVFDPIGGGSQIKRSNRALRDSGRLVWFGMVAVEESGRKAILSTMFNRLLLGFKRDGKTAPLTSNDIWDPSIMKDLLQLLADGSIDPQVAERIPLDEAVQAHRLMERGGNAGKIVLIPGH